MSAAKKAAYKPAPHTRLTPPGPLSGDGITPVLPREGIESLENRAFDLIREASAFAGQVPAGNQLLVGSLVRSMNCYYSNLIEGHHTHPLDIDAALQKTYQENGETQNLQLEAAAHIRVQTLIDEGRAPAVAPASEVYVRWLHREFYSTMPAALLFVENPDTGEHKPLIPGEFRDGGVAVGEHIPPAAEELPAYMRRFTEAYGNLSNLRQIIALGAAHHRFTWIHPFYDGNGRVVRLMSHAMLLGTGIGNSMWSISRGLARTVERYKTLLANADAPRYNAYDGRGALSEKTLITFCEYFLETCIDQVRFMSQLLDTKDFLSRIAVWCAGEIAAKRLERGSFEVLREVWLTGTILRAAVPGIANVKERQAREIVSRLLARGVLLTETTKTPLRLHCTIDTLEAWFPGLYPPFSRMPETGAAAGALLGMM